MLVTEPSEAAPRPFWAVLPEHAPLVFFGLCLAAGLYVEARPAYFVYAALVSVTLMLAAFLAGLRYPEPSEAAANRPLWVALLDRVTDAASLLLIGVLVATKDIRFDWMYFVLAWGALLLVHRLVRSRYPPSPRRETSDAAHRARVVTEIGCVATVWLFMIEFWQAAALAIVTTVGLAWLVHRFTTRNAAAIAQEHFGSHVDPASPAAAHSAPTP